MLLFAVLQLAYACFFLSPPAPFYFGLFFLSAHTQTSPVAVPKDRAYAASPRWHSFQEWKQRDTVDRFHSAAIGKNTSICGKCTYIFHKN